MNRVRTISRLVFLFALVSAATLASAASPTDVSAAPTVQFVEASQMDDAAIQAASCRAVGPDVEPLAPSSGDNVSSAIDVDARDFTPAAPAARPQRGYCRCSCSSTPNCSTSADCGGSLCLRGPTCC